MRTLLVGLVVIAACGDDPGPSQLPDAPVFDAPDAQTSGVVTLTIVRKSVPAMGVRVYFQNADSSLVSSARTDANGVASATMEAGGFVTAIDPFEVSPADPVLKDLRTYAGVKPGDKLVLSRRDDTPVNFTLVLPTDPASSRYFLFSPCSAFLDVTNTNQSGGVPGPGGAIQLFGCAGTTDLMVLATDASNQSQSSLYAPNVVLANGATIDLTGSTYGALQDATWSYQGVPAGYGGISVESLLVGAHGPVFDSFASATPSMGTAMTSPQKVPPVASALQIDHSTLLGPAFVSQHVVDWGPKTTAHTTVLGNASTPNLLVPDYTSEPVFDFASHKLAWTIDTTAGGQQPDLAIAELKFNRNADSLFWSWQIAAPNTAPSVAYPVLPPGDDAVLNPRAATDGVFVFDLRTVRVPGGYDAARAGVLSIESPFDFATGATGQVVFAQLFRVQP